MKKIIFFGLFIITLVALTGCDWYAEERIIYEDWLCTVNTDGTALNYIRESVGHHFVVTPDSERVILFSTGHIYSMNIDGSNFTTLNDSIGSSSLGPLPSIAETPEGNKIVFSHNEDIYEFDLESMEIRNLTNTTDIRERDPYYSHNGDSISYRTIQDSILTISIMYYNGENKNIVIEYNIPQGTALYLYCPCFSKNGKKIYYILYSFGDEIKYGLYSININGLNNQCIYDGSIANYFLSMPSNANKILFCGYDSLYIMKEDGSDLTNLGEADYYRPVISRDGSKILFANHNRIYIMNINGSERRQILDNSLNSYCKTIAFLPDNKVMCSVERRVQ